VVGNKKLTDVNVGIKLFSVTIRIIKKAVNLMCTAIFDWYNEYAHKESSTIFIQI